MLINELPGIEFSRGIGKIYVRSLREFFKYSEKNSSVIKYLY